MLAMISMLIKAILSEEMRTWASRLSSAGLFTHMFDLVPIKDKFYDEMRLQP